MWSGTHDDLRGTHDDFVEQYVTQIFKISVAAVMLTVRQGG